MMKKLLFTFGLITTGAAALQAQITITTVDIAPIGKQIKQAQDTVPTVTPGPAGASVTWNFTAMDSNIVDTLTFTNPSWTPNGSSFPSSNLAVEFGNQGTAYTLNSSAMFNILGQAAMFNSVPVVLQFNPAEQLLTFPCTYNTAFNNTSGYDSRFGFTQQPGIDSVRVKHYQTKTSKVNAWGTVSTPLLSNQPCIRQRVYQVNVDTLWAHIIFPSGWQVIQSSRDSLVHFTWWANAIGFPLVEMDSMFDGTIGGLSWLFAQPANSGVANISALNSVSVYPNPASDAISFDLRNTNAEYVIVNDVAGREVSRNKVVNEIETLNTSEFAGGAYIFTITGENGQVVGHGKFNIVK